MHPILARFRLDDLFMFGWDGSVPHIGAAWLLIPWALAAFFSMKSAYERNETFDVMALGFWVVVPLVAFFGLSRNAHLAKNGVPIFAYGFMMFTGFLLATLSAARRVGLIGLSTEIIWDLGAWLLIPGVIGARLFYLAQYHERIFRGAQGPGDFLFRAINLTNGGLVFYGGLIAGIGGYFAYCRLRRVSPMLLADVIAPSIFIGLAFGRIGCFMYGCCYGDRCELPWAVSFPADSVPWQALVSRGFISESTPRTLLLHPSQIYSSINAFVIAGLLAVYFRHRAFNGAVLAVGWVIYPITRFILELLRGDELGQFNTSFTISQWVSFGMFAAGVCFLLVTSFVQPRLNSMNQPQAVTS